MSTRSVHGMLVAGLLLAVVPWLSGCARSEPPRLYVLSPMELAAGEPGRPLETAVGVGPVEIAPHLDRPEIVVRAGANRLELSEFDTWAEPLREGLARVIAENLSVLLDGQSVAVYPWEPGQRIALQVIVDVRRMDVDFEGRVTLHVSWSVVEGRRERSLASRRSDLQAQVVPGDVAAAVVAQNALVGELSRAMAAELRRLAAAAGARAAP